jgi:hypothetical protein
VHATLTCRPATFARGFSSAVASTIAAALSALASARRAAMPALALAIAVALSTAPVAAAARDLPLDAPLGVATESPLRQLFLDVTGADARPPSGARLAARWVISNSWTTRTTFARGDEAGFLQLDTQADALLLSAKAPWTSVWPGGADAPVIGAVVRRLTTSVEARATVWWGGWSDSVVETWHGLGFTNFEREDHPRDNVRVHLSGGGDTAFDARGTQLSLGGLALRNQLLLAQGGSSLRASSPTSRTGGSPPAAPRSRWAVSLRFDLKLPLGSPSQLGSSGGTDAGAGLLFTAELAPRCVVHANVFTSAWQRLEGAVPLRPRRLHHGAELSAAFVGRRWALLVENRLLSPVFSDEWRRFGEEEITYPHLAATAAFATTRWHNQISVGLRRGAFTAWFSEDFTPGGTRGSKYPFYNSNTPDISAGVELARAL